MIKEEFKKLLKFLDNLRWILVFLFVFALIIYPSVDKPDIKEFLSMMLFTIALLTDKIINLLLKHTKKISEAKKVKRDKIVKELTKQRSNNSKEEEPFEKNIFIHVVMPLIILLLALFTIIFIDKSPFNLMFIILILIIMPGYIEAYFQSKEFINIKAETEKYIEECNDFNEYIQSLKKTDLLFDKTDYGEAIITDTSTYRTNRKYLNDYSSSKHIYDCSLTVCRNAHKKPFEYICKYFNIKKNETSLNNFEKVLNNFLSVEQSKTFLINKKAEILKSIDDKIPILIKILAKKKFEEELGFIGFDFSDIYFPEYTMRYISPGGYTGMEMKIIMNPDNLEKFINYLNDHIKWRKSIAGQRALMTPALREKIKKEDNYTCQICKNSTQKEPNLLLEIDHIVPISKGGLTTRKNLQTLCWKCNRKKGATIQS